MTDDLEGLGHGLHVIIAVALVVNVLGAGSTTANRDEVKEPWQVAKPTAIAAWDSATLRKKSFERR